MTGSDNFVTTRWTRVVAARGDSPEARQALSDLCALNYAPVLRFLRAHGHDAEEARDLTHEFFADVLGHRSLEGVDPARGRFRSYLLGALKHFLANRRARDARLKRGAGLEPLPLAGGSGTEHGGAPAALQIAEEYDALFDREWALAIVERGLLQIEEENAASGTHEILRALKPWLSANGSPPPQADVAAGLGMSEGAVKVAIHRLRKRFREIVRREVAQTIQDEKDLPAEMEHLIAALARS